MSHQSEKSIMSKCGQLLHFKSVTLLAICLLANHAAAAADLISAAASVVSCIGDASGIATPDCDTCCKFWTHNFFEAGHRWAAHLIEPETYYHAGMSKSHVPPIFVPGRWEGWTTEKNHDTFTGTKGVVRWTIAVVRTGQKIGYFYMMWAVPWKKPGWTNWAAPWANFIERKRNCCAIGTSSECMTPDNTLYDMMFERGYQHSALGRPGPGDIHHFHDFSHRIDQDGIAWVNGFGIHFKMTIGSGDQAEVRIMMMPNVDGLQSKFSRAEIARLRQLSASGDDEDE